MSATGVYTLTGRGDIAPDETLGDTVQMSFQGISVGVLFMVALGALFVTAEYKRGLIRTTFTATPGRRKVLAAKTLVMAGATFAVTLPATALAFTLAQSTLRDNGFEPPPSPTSPSWRTRHCARSPAAHCCCPWWRSWRWGWEPCSATRQGRSPRWWS